MIGRSFAKSLALFALGILFCCAHSGCGKARPLVFEKNPRAGRPWCAPNERVRVGKRVVGHVHDGPKYQDFLVDDKGQEHDPEKIADQAWSYLERTGDARKIEGALIKEANQSAMSVVSINPVVVVLETYHDPSWEKQPREFARERWYWRAQVYSLREPVFRENLQWFSPDLKQRPTALRFSEAGVAEIALPKGKLTLTREGDKCQTARE
ncbi:MAG: hypothetical protein ACT4QC_03930 [Planctomycetaceae bacterium]